MLVFSVYWGDTSRPKDYEGTSIYLNVVRLLTRWKVIAVYSMPLANHKLIPLPTTHNTSGSQVSLRRPLFTSTSAPMPAMPPLVGKSRSGKIGSQCKIGKTNSPHIEAIIWSVMLTHHNFLQQRENHPARTTIRWVGGLHNWKVSF